MIKALAWGCVSRLSVRQSSIHIRSMTRRPPAAVAEGRKAFRSRCHLRRHALRPSQRHRRCHRAAQSRSRPVEAFAGGERCNRGRAGVATDRRGRQIEELLAEVLAQHTKAGNAGAFRIQPEAGVHHVVPVAFKGLSGAKEGCSPSTHQLHSAKTEETATKWSCESWRRCGGHRNETRAWDVSNEPIPAAARHRRGCNEPARDVLWRVLQSIRPDLSWKLFCDIGESGSCALNIHIVKPNSGSRVPQPHFSEAGNF